MIKIKKDDEMIFVIVYDKNSIIEKIQCISINEAKIVLEQKIKQLIGDWKFFNQNHKQRFIDQGFFKDKNITIIISEKDKYSNFILN